MRKLFTKALAGSLATVVAFSGVVFIQPKETNTIVSAAEGEYKLVWSDEFNGNELDRSIWNVEVNGNGGGNEEHQYYLDRKENIKVENGNLVITAIKDGYGGKEYTSGRMNSSGKFTFKYGKIEARMKLPKFQGIWPAFWTLGANYSSVGWPKCGEMDIMEAINGENQVYANLHWSYNGSHAYTQEGKPGVVADRTQWHTYGMEWTKTKASFYVDGKVFQTYDIAKGAQMDVAFNKPQFIIFNLAVGGTWPGHNIDETKFPATMMVDWVRLYQKPEEAVTPYSGPMVEVTENAIDLSKAKWGEYYGTGWAGANGSSVANGTKPEDGITMNITKVGNDRWGIQASLKGLTYYPGATYTYKSTILSDVNKRIFVKIAGDADDELHGDYINLKAGVPYEYSCNYTVPEDYEGVLDLFYGLGKCGNEDPASAESAAKISITNVSFTTTATVPKYLYNEHHGIKEPVTTTQTTTQTTTKSATITDPIVKAKVKVAKATKKSKASKKVTVTLSKKIKKANGYQVRVFKSKSNAKKNKSAIAKTTIKKNTKTLKVSGKKLKNKKTLYVRVRAYKKVSGKKVYSKKWSDVKKVKVK